MVTVHDVGQEGGILFFTMDFVDGPSLGSLLKTKRFSLSREEGETQGVLTLDEVLSIACGICEGLEQAHKDAVEGQMQRNETTLIEEFLNQKLGEPLRRDAMTGPVMVAGVSKEDMRMKSFEISMSLSTLRFRPRRR